MRHSEFKIGLEFYISGRKFRCTDVGQRTICAIRMSYTDPSWYNGPPYPVPEIVIDEDDFPACSLKPDA